MFSLVFQLNAGYTTPPNYGQMISLLIVVALNMRSVLKEIIYEGDFTTKFMETFSIKGGD
jgi:hypothetical protein